MNELFDENSETVKGSLYYLKEYFEHRSVKKKVLDNFSHVWNLLEVRIVILVLPTYFM